PGRWYATKTRAGSRDRAQSPRGELAQSLELLEAFGGIAHHRDEVGDLAPIVLDGNDRELDRKGRAVLALPRHREHVPDRIAALAARHHGVEAVPVARPQTLRNNEIEGLAQRPI